MCLDDIQAAEEIYGIGAKCTLFHVAPYSRYAAAHYIADPLWCSKNFHWLSKSVFSHNTSSLILESVLLMLYYLTLVPSYSAVVSGYNSMAWNRQFDSETIKNGLEFYGKYEWSNNQFLEENSYIIIPFATWLQKA